MDYFIFTNNINKLIAKNGSKKDFAQSLGVTYDTVRRWGLGEFLPGGAELIKIAEKYDVSIDWLLTGKVPPLATDIENWAPETQEACRTVKRVIESGDKTTALALQMNLHAFSQSIDRYDDNRILKKDIEQLKREVKQLKKINDNPPEDKPGTDMGVLLTTGKKEALYTPISSDPATVHDTPCDWKKPPDK